MTIAEIVVATLVIVATVFVVGCTLLQLRAPDALTRANLLGPLVCLAFPILLVAKLVRTFSTTGFDLGDLIMALLAIAGVWIVGSVGTFVMGRVLYGVTVSDKRSS
ncbi:Na+/H+ antiporter subunit G [Corynebacterium sp. Q4381]|uniref:Na+/H+ antiporter subunit G n=1 Tax=Corynebacterium sp. Marseille-Q4381 TaxID=3121597 RepID=UPI002FE635B4